MHTTTTTPVLAPTYSSPSRVIGVSTRNPQDSPRYYDNTPSGGQLLYSNPEFPNATGVLVSKKYKNSFIVF
jgi:hypothetical protein